MLQAEIVLGEPFASASHDFAKHSIGRSDPSMMGCNESATRECRLPRGGLPVGFPIVREEAHHEDQTVLELRGIS
jgi:hypothetical protein